MGLLSILPEEYAFVETWVGRFFFIFGVITIGPWVFLMIYDFLLYLVRAATYEIPFVGGRARGKARPRAPSLTERPSGHRRKFSLARLANSQASTNSSRNLKTDAADSRSRNIQEENDGHTMEKKSAVE
ncbi:hypothetical protein P280DRAFT_390423 [Massarina eburnea CBS 473.64]|uniref:Uncharacterized protein n=1 Tax=Massarina eburnea CBS 473.64 TaxID=1395130 RepID=A0A6A6SEJ5_9PLEO|nr:hypothetical protein P280DRAFT_390423 [Massarina eburnea CBS 473.64]